MEEFNRPFDQNGRVALYSVLRSGIKDLQDDRNFQTQRFQTLAIALGSAYGVISVAVDGMKDPLFFSVALVVLNLSSFMLTFFWYTQMGILRDAFSARYAALRRVADLLELPVNPYSIDYECRNEILAKSKRWPKTTSDLQKIVPLVQLLVLLPMSILTLVQVLKAFGVI